MSKIITKISELKMGFNTRDILLLASVLFGFFLFVEESILTSVSNPTNTFFPFWFLIISFVIMISSLSLYFYFFIKNDKKLPYYSVLFIILVLVIVNGIVIFTTPDISVVTIHKTEASYTIITTLSSKVKVIYFFSFITVLLGFYIGFAILPQKITSGKIFSYLNIILATAALAALIYSLIAEWDNYITFFSKIFGGDHDMYNIDDYAPKSFFPHRNVYGTALEFVLICCFIDYSLNHTRYNLIIIPIVLINLILTFCKSGLVGALLATIIWVGFNLYKSIRKKDKLDTIWFGIYSSVIVLFAFVFIILYIASPTFQLKFSYFTHLGNTIKSRSIIWDNCWQIINSRSVVTGAGFGVYNSILFNANDIIIGDAMSVSHSFFFSILGRGGLLILICYFALLGYVIFKAIRIWKKDYALSITLILCLMIFVIHSLMEDNYYLVFVIAIEIMIIHAMELWSNKDSVENK